MSNRIYVGNLPYSADNAQLSQLFSAYGEVVDARVITDRATGQSKGFGFVELSSEDDAKRAISELNGTMLGNRALRLDEASERPGGSRRDNGYSDRPRRDSYSQEDRW